MQSLPSWNLAGMLFTVDFGDGRIWRLITSCVLWITANSPSISEMKKYASMSITISVLRRLPCRWFWFRDSPLQKCRANCRPGLDYYKIRSPKTPTSPPAWTTPRSGFQKLLLPVTCQKKVRQRTRPSWWRRRWRLRLGRRPRYTVRPPPPPDPYLATRQPRHISWNWLPKARFCDNGLLQRRRSNKRSMESKSKIQWQRGSPTAIWCHHIQWRYPYHPAFLRRKIYEEKKLSLRLLVYYICATRRTYMVVSVPFIHQSNCFVCLSVCLSVCWSICLWTRNFASAFCADRFQHSKSRCTGRKFEVVSFILLYYFMLILNIL